MQALPLLPVLDPEGGLAVGGCPSSRDPRGGTLALERAPHLRPSTRARLCAVGAAGRRDSVEESHGRAMPVTASQVFRSGQESDAQLIRIDAEHVPDVGERKHPLPTVAAHPGLSLNQLAVVPMA